MIPRYTRAPMGAIWSEESKFRAWLEVETVTSEVLAEDGIVPAAAARAIRERGAVDLERMKAIEAEVRHDVIAFTTAVAEKVGPEARWLHYGLTSNDVVDTAQALQIKSASAILRDDILRLIGVLKARALEFQHTPTVGRTHGMHAEPTTFGLKLLNWFAEMRRYLQRFDLAAEQM
ncbi:MAG: lyase family protein, partial [Acidobacteriaceae bacterium]